MNRITYDFHIHSCLSPCGDDDSTPGNIAGMGSLIGLQAMALTDHNSCKNCEAFLAATKQYDIIGIPGMELCTSEEVHVLCYFGTLEDAMGFDAFLQPHLSPISNNPKFFGNQLLVDSKDQVIGQFDPLLIAATDISFDQIPIVLAPFSGVCVPAHIDKQANSLLGNLGFVPPGSTFHAYEVANTDHAPALVEQNPYLKNCHMLCSSDAHQLSTLHEAHYYLHVEDPTIAGILNVLKAPIV